MDNSFARLASIDVSQHIERKGQFAYLSWPYAVAQLRLADPTATWEVRRFNGLPFLKTEAGYFVEVAVTVQGVTLSQLHPVLDGRNRPIADPSVFDLNTSIQRCLVKAIALHGLGLSVYGGEDLPTTPDDQPPAADQPAPTRDALPASQAQIRFIHRLIEQTGSDLQRVLGHFGVAALEELTVQAASRLIKSLESRRKAA